MGRPTFQVPRKRQHQRNAALVQQSIHIDPRGTQHDRLRGIAAGRLKNGIDIFAIVFLASGRIAILLPPDLQSGRGEDAANLLGHLATNTCIDAQRRDLVPVGPKDILLATTEIGVDLTGKQGVLGDVGFARVVFEREQEEPCDADDDAEGGEDGDESKDLCAPERTCAHDCVTRRLVWQALRMWGGRGEVGGLTGESCGHSGAEELVPWGVFFE